MLQNTSCNEYTLYDYRRVYHALLVREFALRGIYNVHKSKKYFDGNECFSGKWFVVQMSLPTWQVLTHYEMKYWDDFVCEEREFADEWDGHNSITALGRMEKFLQTLK